MRSSGTIENGSVAEEIRRRYDEWLAALVANDAELIADFVSDDWVFVSSNGVSEGARFLELVGAGTLSHSMMERVGEPRIQVYGDVATLTVRVRNTAHYEGGRVDADEWTTDVFVRHDGRWLCVLTQLTDAA